MKKQSKSLFPFCLCILGVLFLFNALWSQQTAAEMFEKALYLEEAQGDLQKAIGVYEKILAQYPDDRSVAAKAQLHIGLCYEKLGLKEAERAFQKVIADYPERLEEVKTAKEKLSFILRTRSITGVADKGLSVRLLWSGPDTDSVGKASPDGMFLSYIDHENANLCIKEIASGKTTIVTTKEPWGKSYEFAVSSCWSFDGKQLAYGWFNKDNSIELRTIDTDGSDVRVLYQQKNEMAFPMAWSPDGRSIAVSLMRDFYKSYNVSLISVEDGSVKVLKTAKLLKTAPKNMTFSSDSRYLVVDLPQGDDDPKHDLFAFSVDGQKEMRISKHPADDSVLEWIPGSNNLLFLSDRTGTQDAWIVEFADGQTRGEPRLVRKDLGQVTPLGLSREGSFFYRLGSEMTDIAIASIDLEKQALVEPPKILPLPVVGANYHPQWSPDGKYLAYLSNPRSGPGGASKPALWIRSADTGETREITTNLQSIARPCWAPDGHSLFVVGNDGKTFLGIFQIQVQTGQTTFFVDSEPGANIKFIAPAPDGKSVYYTYFEFAKKRCRIMSIGLSNREIRELYRQEAPPDIGGLRISPDGKNLVFGTIEPDGSWVLEAFPLPGGPPRKIFSTKANASGVSTAPFWAPDGKRLLFFMDVSKGKDKRSELWSVPVEGGGPQSLGLTIDMNPRSVSLHPDGRRLAFSVSQPSAEVWVMENFLPVEKK
ncbi:MAG: PD40 domain-containing protein [Candidatus Aminicenantes bacterium]|nr:PD40 domain-containing protein [Candidatus Aminicenantes bacterium]